MEANSDKEKTPTSEETESESDSSETSSSHNSSDDDLYYSWAFTTEGNMLGVKPYQFEPLADSNDDTASSSEDDESRLTNLDWCSCSHCQIMETAAECVCCQEVTEVVNKNNEVFETEKLKEKPTCITKNPGFQKACLDPLVLQVAEYQYKGEYGKKALKGLSKSEKNRKLARQQFVMWCWWSVDEKMRVRLPSCAVHCIRTSFPPSQ